MITEFKISKNIPIPEKRALLKYPFEEMGIGDSFLFDEFSPKAMLKICQSIGYYCRTKNPTRKFCTRKTEDGMIRVWRIK